MFPALALLLGLIISVQGFCGDSIRWAHHFKIDDVFGMWHGVGYAQHSPDMTNKPNEVGCVTLHITDAFGEQNDEDWLDWSLYNKRNYSDQNWRSYKSNPWSGTSLSGSWLDIRIKRKVKRDMYNEKRLHIIWDEDGQTMEQDYLYTPDAPGLWVAEQKRPLEKVLSARGVDIWYPDDPPRHPQVVRVLKVTPHMMIINHCSEIGDGGMFSLILRRSPSRMQLWEWYDLQRQFYSFELPTMHRYYAICAACHIKNTIFQIVICLVILGIWHQINES